MSLKLFGSYRLGSYAEIAGTCLLWGLIIWGGMAGWHFIQVGRQIGQLKDPDPATRAHAAGQLAKHPSSRAVQPLLDALNDTDFNVADSAVQALGASKDARAVQPLIAGLKDSSSTRYSHAADALGDLGALAVPSLVAALHDPDIGLQEGSRQALTKAGKPAVDSLIALLSDPDPRLREDAADTLGQIKDARAVDPLVNLLHSPDENLRATAAEALGAISDKRALDPLIAAMQQDPAATVKINAAEALGALRDKRADQPLIAAVQSKDPAIATAATRSIGQIDDSQAEEFLMGQFAARNLDVIADASTFFIKKGKSGSEDVLIQALNKTGNSSLAQDMLNCGNAKLHDAATDWAAKNGYEVTYNAGAKTASWGSGW